MMNTSDKYFTARFSFDPDRKKVWSAICDYLQKYVDREGVALDIGCGYCDFINNIQVRKKFAMDYSTESARFANEEVSFITQSALLPWPFQDESLDTIFASNFFEHFTDSELDVILNSITKTLKLGGKLILLQPNYYYAYREYWDDYTHKKAFSHTALSDFLSSKGFKVNVVKKRFLPFSMKSFLPKSYWLTKFYIYSPYKPMGKQMLVIAEK